MASQHPLDERIHHFMEEMQSTRGIIDCALISREGSILGKRCRDEVPGALFAAVTATMLASAETANNLLSLPEPSCLVSYTPDMIFLVMGAGEKMLVGATADRSTDFTSLFERLQDITTRIGGEVIV
jgi:predicted regulator of Ras-like GTPase activity (Roadblock/LC7/MglB family)